MYTYVKCLLTYLLDSNLTSDSKFIKENSGTGCYIFSNITGKPMSRKEKDGSYSFCIRFPGQTIGNMYTELKKDKYFFKSVEIFESAKDIFIVGIPELNEHMNQCMKDLVLDFLEE